MTRDFIQLWIVTSLSKYLQLRLRSSQIANVDNKNIKCAWKRRKGGKYKGEWLWLKICWPTDRATIAGNGGHIKVSKIFTTFIRRASHAILINNITFRKSRTKECYLLRLFIFSVEQSSVFARLGFEWPHLPAWRGQINRNTKINRR